MVFDVELLARRLRAAAEWVRGQPATRDFPVGYFGASTGAVAGVVSRGGRTDLAMPILPRVQAPTLLIVSDDDRPVIAMNENALRRLRCEKRLTIVPGASHLFEEPGTLDEVVHLATAWFREHLRAKRAASRPPAGRARR